MITVIIVVFLIGYLFIALEHVFKINKAASALVTGVIVWILYAVIAPDIIPNTHSAEFTAFLANNPTLQAESTYAQVMKFVSEFQVVDSLGEISETLFFLLGAMAIVELIDVHGGFNIITNRITTRRKRQLLWIVATLTFFLSAILDNMTTAIVMVAMLRKIIGNYKERWLFAGIIIIAANSGGAWSPIGDITTIMLWVDGNVTVGPLISHLFLPSLVSLIIPTAIASRWLTGEVSTVAPTHTSAAGAATELQTYKITRGERLSILLLGIGCLVSVPVFKTITHLPPFMGVLLALGIMWVYTELMYKGKKSMPQRVQARVPYVLRKVDTPTILFFLGILLAVSALQASGVLSGLSYWLDAKVHNVYAINLMVGGLSAVVDNVPLVAGSIATYPVVDPALLATAADPAYTAAFVQDGTFWHLLAYCAGVGGSMLIIGSASGVVVMGLEKMNFMWYLKNISLIAVLGYLAGAGVFMLQQLLF